MGWGRVQPPFFYPHLGLHCKYIPGTELILFTENCLSAGYMQKGDNFIRQHIDLCVLRLFYRYKPEQFNVCSSSIFNIFKAILHLPILLYQVLFINLIGFHVFEMCQKEYLKLYFIYSTIYIMAAFNIPWVQKLKLIIQNFSGAGLQFQPEKGYFPFQCYE